MKALVLAMAILGLADAARAVTLSNGSFEQPDIGAPGAGGSLTGWTVGPGGAGLLGDGAAEGQYAAHLHGGRGGWLNQTVTGLVIGDRYEFAFDMMGDTAALSRVVFAMILTPGTSWYMAAVDETPADAPGWTRTLFYFDAPTTEVTLSFYSPYQGDRGARLDNVRLGVAPVPAALPMLVAALGGLVWLRRRRS